MLSAVHRNAGNTALIGLANHALLRAVVLLCLERWAHLASNQGPTGYEPVALPTELWAQTRNMNLLKTLPPVKQRPRA
jgi:hypothetical protein